MKLLTRYKSRLRGISDPQLLCLSMVIGALLRVCRLGSQSIWGDEALTLQVYAVGGSFRELLANIWDKAFHPPVYFVIIRYWIELGRSEFMLRFPSAVFGIAVIPIVYLITRRFFRTGVPGIAALVVALSPFGLWYSQEARMYSLQILLAGACTLAFLRAWKTQKPADYGLYVLAALAGLYTHIGMLLLVAGHGVFALGAAAGDRKRLLAWGIAIVIVLLGFAPWAANFLSAHRDIGGDSAIGFARNTGVSQLAYTLYTFSVGFSLGPSVSGLHFVSARSAVMSHLPAILLTATVFGILALLGLMHASQAHRFGFWFLVCSFAVPVSIVALASLLPGFAVNARYLTVAIIPFWIFVALGIHASARIRGGFVLPLLAAGLVTASARNYYLDPAYAKQDMRSAVALVTEKARLGDVIVISSVEIGGPFIYYFRRADVPYLGYPPRRGRVDPRRLPADMRRILHGKSRAWLVLGRTWSSDPHGLIPRYFSSRHKSLENRAFPGVMVLCYDLSRSPETTPIRRIHD